MIRAITVVAGCWASATIVFAASGPIAGDYRRESGGAPTRNEASLRLTVAGGDRVVVKGSAVWIGSGPGDVHDAEVSGTFQVVGSERIDVRGPGGCRFTIRLAAGGLDVSGDTGRCGGMNVVFDGHYAKQGQPAVSASSGRTGAAAGTTTPDRPTQPTPDQAAALAAAFPGMRVVTACRGRFGAGDGVVAGVVAADPAKAAEGIRAGVVRDGDRWVVHKLDDDVRASVNTVLDSWPPGTKGRAEDAPILCNPAPGRGRELQFGPGNKPRFDLAKAGLRQQTIACFATSDVYNNWDCLVFNPSRRRFVLWYRQTHAD